MDRWSYWSGFYSCGLGAAQVTWPIKVESSADLNNLISNPTIILGIASLDKLTKDANKWKQEEYNVGCFQGTGARIELKIVLDAVRALCPQCAAYVPVLQ